MFQNCNGVGMGLIARSKISRDGMMRVPAAVRRFFSLREGDIFEWYPPYEEIQPEDAELIAIKIVRGKRGER